MTTLYSRIGSVIVALLGVGALVMAACSQGSEGDRCNPNLNAGNPECNSGLTCMQPPLCPEAYCCPTLADGGLAPSASAWCQTGCNGGAASICNSGADAEAACEFACTNDPGDLSSANASSCSSSGPDAGADAPSEATSPAADGGTDAGNDTGTVADAGPG
jgi:hypothetical protein